MEEGPKQGKAQRGMSEGRLEVMGTYCTRNRFQFGILKAEPSLDNIFKSKQYRAVQLSCLKKTAFQLKL